LLFGAGEIPEMAVLPAGIKASFSCSALNLYADSSVLVKLTLSVESEVVAGVYELRVFAEQKKICCSGGISVPVTLTIS